MLIKTQSGGLAAVKGGLLTLELKLIQLNRLQKSSKSSNDLHGFMFEDKHLESLKSPSVASLAAGLIDQHHLRAAAHKLQSICAKSQ